MCLYPIKIKPHRLGEPRGSGQWIKVKCGKCLECQKQKSIEWAFRIMHEAFLHEKNCFLTLTYNNENLPDPPSVSHREVQLFMKSFRQKISPVKVRFFACGEYGSKNRRPHYHIIVFGYSFTDGIFWQKDGKNNLFRSPTLESIWKKGFSSYGDLTLESALYCAKYLNKLSFKKEKHTYPVKDSMIPADPSYGVQDPDEVPFRESLIPPFVQMSNRRGIGYDFAFKSDLESDRVYIGGKSTKIPRYYLKVLEEEGVYLDEFKARRIRDGEKKEASRDIEVRREKALQIYRKNFLKNP